MKFVDKRAGICYNERMRKPEYLTEMQTAKLLSISARTAGRLIEKHGIEVLGEVVLPMSIAEGILGKKEARRVELEKRLAPIRRQLAQAAEITRGWN